MTSGGGAGGRADTVFIDVQGRFEEFERRLQEVEQGAGEAGERTGSRFSGALTVGLATATGAALALGGTLIAAAKGATDMASQAAQNVSEFESKLGASREEAERLGEVAKQVFGDNWTGSLAEAGEAVANVRREVKGLTDEELRQVTGATVAIAETFDEEQGRVAAAVQSVMDATGMSAQQATDFITAGFQKGLNSSGDFLDTLTEYAPQFEKAKIGGGELFSLLETGAAKGALGTDKIADAFKEFGLTIVDVSDGSKDVYAELGLNQEKLVKGINDGSVTQAKAFEIVTNALSKVKGQADRTRIGAAIFGGAGEDFANGLTQLDLTKTKLADLGGSTESLNRRYENLGQFLEGAWRQVQLALIPVGDELLKIANEALPYLQKGAAWLGERLPGWIKTGVQAVKDFGTGAVNAYTAVRPAIDSTVASVQKFSAFLERNKEILIPLASGIGTVAAALAIHRAATIAATAVTTAWTVATTAATAASVALRAALAFITGPVGLAVAAITALVAAGVYLYRNWDEVKAKALAIWGQVKEIVSNAIGGAVNYLKNIDLKEVALDMIRGYVNGIRFAGTLVLKAVQGLGSTVINGIKALLRIQSPSRVMQELGEFTGQGFAKGIESEVPRVQKAAKATASAFLAALADLKDEKAVGRVDLSTYTRTLEQARSQLQAQLKTVKEGTPAYTEWLGALVKVTSELDSMKGKTTDAQKAAKEAADELARNRKQLEDGISYEQWKAGLEGYTKQQLLSAAAAERAAGNQQRYNDVLSEQRRRTEASTQAQRDFVAALDEGIRAGNSALDSLDSITLGGRDLAATAQRLPDTAKLFSELYARLGKLRAELQVPGVADAWADSIEEMGKRGQLSAQQVGVLKDIITDLSAVPVPQALDNLQGRGVQNEPAADDPATGALASGEGDRLRAAMDRLNLDDVGRIYADLVLAGLKDSDLGQLIADYLLEQQNAINAALAESGGVSINVDTGEEVYQTEEELRGIGVAAENTSDTLLDLGSVIENVLTMPWDEVAALLSASDLDPGQIEAITKAWRDFHLEAAQTEALDEQLAPVAKRLQEVYDQLQAGTLQGADALTTLDDVRAELEGIGGDAAKNLLAVVNELTGGVQKSIDAADQLHAKWVDNLNRMGFQEWVKGLDDLSRAELDAALEAARAAENVEEFNAILAEIQDRTINVTFKINGIDTGVKMLDVYKTAISGISDFIKGTFESLASGAGITAGSVVKSFAIMALGVVEQIATMIAAQAALALATAIMDGATLNPRVVLTAAAAVAIAGIAAGFKSRLSQSASVPSGTPASPSSAPTAPIAQEAAGVASNSVTIPNGQVTVIAAPEWVTQMGQHVDRFGGYVQTLVSDGIRIHTNNSAPTAPASGPGLAWDLRT